jgi:hypothetical protein
MDGGKVIARDRDDLTQSGVISQAVYGVNGWPPRDRPSASHQQRQANSIDAHLPTLCKDNAQSEKWATWGA